MAQEQDEEGNKQKKWKEKKRKSVAQHVINACGNMQHALVYLLHISILFYFFPNAAGTDSKSIKKKCREKRSAATAAIHPLHGQQKRWTVCRRDVLCRRRCDSMPTALMVVVVVVVIRLLIPFDFDANGFFFIKTLNKARRRITAVIIDFGSHHFLSSQTSRRSNGSTSSCLLHLSY